MTRITTSNTGFKNKIVTVLAILLAVTATSFAFAHLKDVAITHYHGTNGDHGKMLKEKLGLTDEQAVKVDAIMADFKVKMKELHHNSEGNREAMHKEMMALKEELNAEMKAVLTPEQYTKFEEMHRKHGHRGPHGHHGNFDPEKMKELHQEMRAYALENIDPVLRPKRAELEKVISEEDKAKIAEMRTQMKEMHTRRHEAKNGEDCEKACHGKKGGEGNNTGHHRRGHSESHGEMKALLEKYDGEITKLLADLEDEKEKWHADMKAIAAKHMGEDADQRHGEGSMRHHGSMGKIHFLLMDPNGTSDLPEIDEPSVYPNPAATANNIELDVVETGNVRIDVLDKDGNFIRTAKNKSYEKGKHTININIDDLEPGIYIFQIDMGGTKFAKRFVKR